MKAASLNLAEWLRRLGVRPAGGDLEVFPTVQPVALVHDGTAHTSALLPPAAFAGFSQFAPVAQFVVIDFRSLAPGGSFVRYASVDSSTAHSWRFALTTTPVALANAATVHVMAGAPRSTVLFDALAAGTLAATDPSLGRMANNGMAAIDDLIFVPQGSILRIESDVAVSGNKGCLIVWTEAQVE